MSYIWFNNLQYILAFVFCLYVRVTGHFLPSEPDVLSFSTEAIYPPSANIDTAISRPAFVASRVSTHNWHCWLSCIHREKKKSLVGPGYLRLSLHTLKTWETFYTHKKKKLTVVSAQSLILETIFFFQLAGLWPRSEWF